MAETPGTTHADTSGASSIGWNDAAELHKCSDGGGVFHRFMSIRRGTFAELIDFVVHLPEEHQQDYAIQKEGDRQFKIGEIRSLFRRLDFPRAHG